MVEQPESFAEIDNAERADGTTENVFFWAVPWQGRLTSRSKLLRGSLTAGIVLLGLILVLAATGSLPVLSGFLPRTSPTIRQPLLPYTIHGHTPIRLPADNPQSIILPVPTSPGLFSYTVDPNQPQHIVLCISETATSGTTTFAPGPILVWQTMNGGLNWRQLSLPHFSGIGCNVSLGVDNAHWLLVETDGTDSLPPSAACANETLYLSKDLGASWQSIPYTTIAPFGSQGGCHAWVTTHHIFVETNYSTGIPPTQQIETLERSDDLGTHWQRTVAPFQQSLRPQYLNIIPGGDGETLLAEVANISADPANVANPQLWFSRDAGASWNLEETIPEASAGHLFAPPFVTSKPTALTVLYATIGDQIPAFLFRLRVLMRGSGQRWGFLPPLPVPGASPERTGLLQVLGVLPDGRLVALGVDPDSSVPAANADLTQAPRQALWLWDPTRLLWESLSVSLTPAWSQQCTELCWYAQLSSGINPSGAPEHDLYLLNWFAAPNSLYRVRLP